MLLDIFVVLGVMAASRQGVLADPSAGLLQQSALDVCPWSPLGAVTVPTCGGRRARGQIQLDTTTTTPRQNRTETAAEAPKSAWVGGKRCAGVFCLWANRDYAGGRGIVVITDPYNLEKVKQREVGLLALQAARDALPPPSFEMRTIEGKGLGLVANKTLTRGDDLMAHAPVLLVHRTFVEQFPTSQKHPILDYVPMMMPSATRRLFVRQKGHFGGHKITDILTTNSFQMDLGGDTDGHHYGNFPEVSRFNHDCRPNAVFRIGQDMVHRTTVIREVKPGEELTISYLDPLGQRAARMKRAKAAWGFECACSQCAASEAAAAASDARLSEIDALEKTLSDFSAKVTLDMVDRYLGLFRTERLEAKMFGAYTTAALNCNLLGEEAMARDYALKAVEAGMLEDGPGAADVTAMRELAADPRKHFTWRRRLS